MGMGSYYASFYRQKRIRDAKKVVGPTQSVQRQTSDSLKQGIEALENALNEWSGRSSGGGDPYWLTLKYPGTCKKCGKQMKRGEKAFRYNDGAMYCDSDKCGKQAHRDFAAAVADES